MTGKLSLDEAMDLHAPVDSRGLREHFARTLDAIPRWRVAKSRVRVVQADGEVIPVVVVDFADGPGKTYCLTAGVPVLHQVAANVFGSAWRSDRKALEGLLESMAPPPGLAEVEEALRREADRLARDPDTVRKVRARIEAVRERVRQARRRQVVSSLRELMDEGWTREDVLSAWDEATVREVHEK